jgi:hypothetical protein
MAGRISIADSVLGFLRRPIDSFANCGRAHFGTRHQLFRSRPLDCVSGSRDNPHGPAYLDIGRGLAKRRRLHSLCRPKQKNLGLCSKGGRDRLGGPCRVDQFWSLHPPTFKLGHYQNRARLDFIATLGTNTEGSDCHRTTVDFEPHVTADRELICRQNPRSDHQIEAALVTALDHAAALKAERKAS